MITGGVAVTTQVPSVADLTTQANNGLYFSDLLTEGVVGFIYFVWLTYVIFISLFFGLI